MIDEKDLEEMIETFKQLPEWYQILIFDNVKDKKKLYDLQSSSSKIHVQTSSAKNVIAEQI